MNLFPFDRSAEQLPLVMPAADAMESCDFIPSASNAAARKLIAGWPMSWGNETRSAIIHGASGSGKTHLLKVWRNTSGGAELDVSALSDYSRDFVAEKGAMLAVDNADAVAGNDDRERGLFHLYNRVVEQRGWLLLAASSPPSRWGVRLPDLSSRLNAIVSAELLPPDDDMLALVLAKLLSDRRLDCDEAAIDRILKTCERSPAALRALANRLDEAAARHKKRRITLAMVAESA